MTHTHQCRMSLASPTGAAAPLGRPNGWGWLRHTVRTELKVPATSTYLPARRCGASLRCACDASRAQSREAGMGPDTQLPPAWRCAPVTALV